MIALRLLLGKTSQPPSCTYENKCCVAEHDENERLRELAFDLEERLANPVPSEAEYNRFRAAQDENILQRILIEQLQSQLAAQSQLLAAPPVYDYTVLHDRISQLETRLDLSEQQLAASVAANAQAKAHITVLQQQRAQLVLELEQVEDGFQAEIDKVNGELRSWAQDMHDLDSDTIHESDPTAEHDSMSTHTRSPSTTSTTPSHSAILTASLERAKSATRIWALEDEIDRVRTERDELRRRLGAGRANLMQLKRQASEVRVSGRGLRGLKSESQLGLGMGEGKGRKVVSRASDMQLNTRVRPVMRGEPVTPETSDDGASLEMKM